MQILVAARFLGLGPLHVFSLWLSFPFFSTFLRHEGFYGWAWPGGGSPCFRNLGHDFTRAPLDFPGVACSL